MTIRIGDRAPDFTAETTMGPIDFYDWVGDSWCILFSHPKDFTPVCTTELGVMAALKPEFDRRDCKIIGLGVDPVERHVDWSKDIEDVTGFAPNYPLIGDGDLAVSKLYGMLPAKLDGSAGNRTAADNATVRSTFIVGPDKQIRLILAYPMTCGRNFAEVLRALDALQMGEMHRLATPANWQPGDDVVIATTVSDDEARKLFPDGWRSPKPYIRYVPQPA
ncbi:MAG: peroxiredoxin [Hyphomicrobiaceae bacterium]